MDHLSQTNELERIRLRFDDLIPQDTSNFPSARFPVYELGELELWIAVAQDREVTLVNQISDSPICGLLSRRPMGLGLMVEKGLRLVNGRRMKVEDYLDLWTKTPTISCAEAKDRGLSVRASVDRIIDQVVTRAQSPQEVELIEALGLRHKANTDGAAEFQLDMLTFEGHLVHYIAKYAWPSGPAYRTPSVTHVKFEHSPRPQLSCGQCAVTEQVDWLERMGELV